jgi:plasmid maintenance system antidote protein VapI
MKTQMEIAEILGIHQSEVSRLLNGKIPVRWPLAEKLADLFPNKSLREWKYATPGQIKRAFSFLEEKESA